MEDLIREAVEKMRKNPVDCIAPLNRVYVNGVIDAYLTLPKCDLKLVHWALTEIENDRMIRAVKEQEAC